jgi:hypothetical protein
LMNNLDAILKDEHESARLLAEVHGDALDDEVFERASAYEDPVLACIKQEVAVPLGCLESIEDGLFARIETFAHDAGSHAADELINMVIAAEQPMPPGVAERLEQRTIGRIEQAKSKKPQAHFVWPLLPVFSALLSHRITRAATFAIVALLAITGVFIGRANFSDSPLLTLITQAYGTAYRDDLVVSVKDGTTLACRNDGSLTLINKAGSVAIHDAIALTLDKASERTVKYSVAANSPAGKTMSAGSVEFSVAKRSKRQRFVVETPYFDIHVVGTRFTVAQERSNEYRTAVTEGMVRISSRLFGDTLLTAGKTLTFIPGRNELRIASGYATSGQGLLNDIAPERAQCRLLVVSVPAHAAVFIDNEAAGITPLATVLPSGTYAISVRSNGRIPLDTLVELKTVPLDLRIALNPAPLGSAPLVNAGVRTTPARHGIPAIDKNRMAMEAAKQALGDAQRFESRNWKKALELYNQLARSMETPPLYRETALFSLSRLTADKLRDTAAAMRDFSRYLILYPRGMFAGEALLRLSELELTRNPASAVDYFRKFLATSPNHPRRADVAYHMGLLLQQHDEYSDAISMFTIALDETKATRPERRHEIARMIADAESLIEAGRAKPAALKSR